MAATSTRTQGSCVTNCVHEQLIVSILQQLGSFISKISNRRCVSLLLKTTKLICNHTVITTKIQICT
jgi:hypothetical protein